MTKFADVRTKSFVGEAGSSNIYDVPNLMALHVALTSFQTDQHVYCSHVRVGGRTVKSREDIRKILAENGMNVIYSETDLDPKSSGKYYDFDEDMDMKDDLEEIFANTEEDNSVLAYLHTYKNKKKEIIFVFKLSIFDESRKQFKTKLLKQIFEVSQEHKQGGDEVYVLAAGSNGGIETHSIGSDSSPLVRNNYREDVVRSFDYCVEQLRSEEPNGALVILSGPPGSGKSFFIRALMSELKECVFIYLPPQMVANLSGPSLIKTLSKIHDENSGQKTVLLIEDADSILAPRMSDNMSDITGLLNLSDGILGKLLSVRVIATTNQHKSNFDAAIMRPGRLCANIFIGPIDGTHASDVYVRLVGEKHPQMKNENTYLLADIYSWAKEYKRTKQHYVIKEASSRKSGF